MSTDLNSETHMVQLVELRPLFLLFPDDNVRNIFKKLASERNFDLPPIKAIFCLSDKIRFAKLIFFPETNYLVGIIFISG